MKRISMVVTFMKRISMVVTCNEANIHGREADNQGPDV